MPRLLQKLMLPILVVAVASCGNPTLYNSQYDEAAVNSFGYAQKMLEPGIWRIRFKGNEVTTLETVQTFWLYHVATLALSNGYQGFKILSDVKFAGRSVDIDSGMFLPVSAGTNYVPGWIEQLPHPTFEADVQFLKAPFISTPGKVFDASKLKNILESYMTCQDGNVCHHSHSYLYPSEGQTKNDQI